MKFMVINGPNINMIGVREKGIYGSKSFTEICEYIKEEGEKRGHEVTLLQSNCEGTMIDFLQRAYFEKFDGVVINPGMTSSMTSSSSIRQPLPSTVQPCIMH